jgi:hypothetical protein
MSRRFLLICCIVASLPWAAGCSEPMPEFGEVSGTVTSKGKPLPKVAVTFLPDPLKGNVADQRDGRNRRSGQVHSGKVWGMKAKRSLLASRDASRHTVLVDPQAYASPRWFSIDYSSPPAAYMKSKRRADDDLVMP